jgi:hypothetical protein
MRRRAHHLLVVRQLLDDLDRQLPLADPRAQLPINRLIFRRHETVPGRKTPAGYKPLFEVASSLPPCEPLRC